MGRTAIVASRARRACAERATAQNRKPLLSQHVAKRGERQPDQRIRGRITAGSLITAEGIIHIHEKRAAMIKAAHAFMEGYDALIMPTCPDAPLKISDVDNDENYGGLNMRCLRNTLIGNFLHTCSISIPTGDPDGPPVGLMLMMPAGSDERLFSIAAAIERTVGLNPS